MQGSSSSSEVAWERLSVFTLPRSALAMAPSRLASWTRTAPSSVVSVKVTVASLGQGPSRFFRGASAALVVVSGAVTAAGGGGGGAALALSAVTLGGGSSQAAARRERAAARARRKDRGTRRRLLRSGAMLQGKCSLATHA